jgi:hypothetical protein
LTHTKPTKPDKGYNQKEQFDGRTHAAAAEVTMRIKATHQCKLVFFVASPILQEFQRDARINEKEEVRWSFVNRPPPYHDLLLLQLLHHFPAINAALHDHTQQITDTTFTATDTYTHIVRCGAYMTV